MSLKRKIEHHIGEQPEDVTEYMIVPGIMAVIAILFMVGSFALYEFIKPQDGQPFVDYSPTSSIVWMDSVCRAGEGK